MDFSQRASDNLLRSGLLRFGIQPIARLDALPTPSAPPLLDVHLPLPSRLLEGRVPVPVPLSLSGHEIWAFGHPYCRQRLLHALEEDLGRLGDQAPFNSLEGPAMPKRAAVARTTRHALVPRRVRVPLLLLDFFVSSSDSSNLSPSDPLPFSCKAFQVSYPWFIQKP